MLSRIKIITAIFTLALLLQACTHNDAWREAKQNFTQNNYAQSFNELWQPAHQGDAKSQYALGYLYFKGLGTVKDPDLGRLWMQMAAKQGYAPAVTALNRIQQTKHNQFNAFEAKTNNKPLPTPNYFSMEQKTDIQWMREQNPDFYTIQVIEDTDNDSIKTALQKAKLNCKLANYRFKQEGDVQQATICGSFASALHAREPMLKLVELNIPVELQRWNSIQRIMLP